MASSGRHSSPVGACVREWPAPRFFASVAAFRTWLKRHHATTNELYVGYYKRGASKQGMTYKEAVDEALCWGWIDGVVRTIDDERYAQRWTPRKATSNWSAVNIAKIAELTAAGRMQPPGIAAFEGRDRRKDAIYSYDKSGAKFSTAQERTFKRNTKAWNFWNTQPPGYRKLATHYVVSAKQEVTRERRLERLIDCCARSERLPGA